MTSRQATGVLVIAGLAVLLLRKRSTPTIVNGATVPDTVNTPGAVVIGNKPIEYTPPFNGGQPGEQWYGGVAGNACRQVQCFHAPCPCLPMDLGGGGQGNIIPDEALPVWHLL